MTPLQEIPDSILLSGERLDQPTSSEVREAQLRETILRYLRDIRGRIDRLETLMIKLGVKSESPNG